MKPPVYQWHHLRWKDENGFTRFHSSFEENGKKALIYHDAYWPIPPKACWRIWRAFQ